MHDINSPLRHVRTRIYFTSESHIHSLVNILRHERQDGRSLLSEAGLAHLDATAEFDYLTQIVFRLYENKTVRRARIVAADSWRRPGWHRSPRWYWYWRLLARGRPLQSCDSRP